MSSRTPLTAEKLIRDISRGISAIVELSARVIGWFRMRRRSVAAVAVAAVAGSGTTVVLQRYSVRVAMMPDPATPAVTMTTTTAPAPTSGALATSFQPPAARLLDFKPLTRFADVLVHATSILEKRDSEIWIVVDVPSYGSNSLPQEYPAYRTALMGLADGSTARRHILWFDPTYEAEYDLKVQCLGPEGSSYALKQSDIIRNALAGDNVEVTNSRLPVLSCTNFWMAKDASGTYRIVICWFTLSGNGTATKMSGYYTENPSVGRMLEEMYNGWKRNETLMSPLVAMSGGNHP